MGPVVSSRGGLTYPAPSEGLTAESRLGSRTEKYFGGYYKVSGELTAKSIKKEINYSRITFGPFMERGQN
jgi:hypothetical protein